MKRFLHSAIMLSLFAICLGCHTTYNISRGIPYGYVGELSEYRPPRKSTDLTVSPSTAGTKKKAPFKFTAPVEMGDEVFVKLKNRLESGDSETLRLALIEGFDSLASYTQTPRIAVVVEDDEGLMKYSIPAQVWKAFSAKLSTWDEVAAEIVAAEVR